MTKQKSQYIFDITFTVRKVVHPFDSIVVESMGEAGGNLVEVVRKFQEEFGPYLRNKICGIYWIEMREIK